MSLSTWAAVAGSVAGGVLLLASISAAADKRVVTDSAGRRVEVPARIERVYAAGGRPACCSTPWRPTRCWAGPGHYRPRSGRICRRGTRGCRRSAG